MNVEITDGEWVVARCQNGHDEIATRNIRQLQALAFEANDMTIRHAGLKLETGLAVFRQANGNPFLLDQVADGDNGFRRNIGRLLCRGLRAAKTAQE